MEILYVENHWGERNDLVWHRREE